MKNIFIIGLKEFWKFMPFNFIIGIIARVFIVSATISYLESVGNLSWFVKIILLLWIFMPIYYRIENYYFNFKYAYNNGGKKDNGNSIRR